MPCTFPSMEAAHTCAQGNALLHHMHHHTLLHRMPRYRPAAPTQPASCNSGLYKNRMACEHTGSASIPPKPTSLLCSLHLHLAHPNF
jgi:hypothetical protein